MDNLQLVYPWSHPFPAGIIMIGLSVLFLIGIYLLYLSFKVQNNKWKIILTIMAIPSISFPTINFIGYQYLEHKTFKEYVGTYISQDNNNELILSNNSTWISRGLPFKCKTGEWDLVITEDGTYIELSCDKSDYHFEQLWPTNDFKIYVIDNKNIENKIELQKKLTQTINDNNQ